MDNLSNDERQMNEQRASSETPLLGSESGIPAASSGPTGYTRRGRGRTPLVGADDSEPVACGQTKQ